MKRARGVFLLLALLFMPVSAIPQAPDLIGLRLIVLRTESEAAAVRTQPHGGSHESIFAGYHRVSVGTRVDVRANEQCFVGRNRQRSLWSRATGSRSFRSQR